MYLSVTTLAASLVNQTLFRSAGCIIDHQHAEKRSGHSGHYFVATWNAIIVKSRDTRPHYISCHGFAIVALIFARTREKRDRGVILVVDLSSCARNTVALRSPTDTLRAASKRCTDC